MIMTTISIQNFSLRYWPRFEMIEGDFPPYNQEGIGRPSFSAHCGGENKDPAHPVWKGITIVPSREALGKRSTLVDRGSGIMLYCQTSQVAWHSMTEIRSFQDLSGKDFRVDLDLQDEAWGDIDADNLESYMPREYGGYDEFRLDYQIANLTAETPRWRGFSSDRFRKKPVVPKPWPRAFMGELSRSSISSFICNNEISMLIRPRIVGFARALGDSSVGCRSIGHVERVGSLGGSTEG